MSIIAIDSGTSITKLINVDENYNIIHKMILDRTSVSKAIEAFIKKENINMKLISKIVLTGVGIDEIKSNIYDIPTIKVDEFQSIGTGGLYLANCEKGLVVSIGTGTAFVAAEGKEAKHIGGTGVGGGTLLNLCKKLGGIGSFNEINELISQGNLENVDLKIKDITTNIIDTLPQGTTSANFGKLNEKASNADLALGIVNMIFETIGVMAVFANRNTNLENIIIVGSVTTIPYINTVLKKIEKLHNVKFTIPKNAEFATAIGAIKSIY